MVIFDIGSFDGSTSMGFVNSLKSSPENLRVYMFEPHPILAENIRQKFKNDKRVSVVEMAVCENDGETDLHMSLGPWWGQDTIQKIGGSCSILKFKNPEDIAKSFDHSTALSKNIPCPPRTDLFYSGKSVPVKTTRMDTFIQENCKDIERIDYLHIDAQGCDMEVLKSFGKFIDMVEEGICECAYDKKSAIYETQKYFLEDIKKWLMENGFDIISIEPNVPYSTDGVNPNELNIRFRKRKS